MRETIVVSHVTLVMCCLVAAIGPVRVMEVGVALKLYAKEVNGYVFVSLHKYLNFIFL